MKHYRIKVRDDKVEFFEELLRYLDFLDYEQVENFSEPRIYNNFELKARDTEDPKGSKRKSKTLAGNKRGKEKESEESSAESLREVLSKIDQMRDESRKNK
ncbi:MAG: hypothetical protein R6U46_12485 [Marinilabilia sp.]